MYAWLTDALHGPSTVITANRRLARVLRDDYSNHQCRAKQLAWKSPDVHSWQDWQELEIRRATGQATLPTHINAHQSQLLWERCLVKEIGESVSGLAGLVRLCRDTWRRMADWQVPIKQVARSAQSEDQRLFAAAAGRYLGILQRQHWVDDAGLSALTLELIESARVENTGRFTFVGFDREWPAVASVMAALARTATNVCRAPVPESADVVGLQTFDTPDAEMRAAGAWARGLRNKDPSLTIAIIAGKLEQDAGPKVRLVQEGLVPGWQYAPPSVAQSINVSFGRRLIDYPAVSIALLLLRWLVRDLGAGEISQLLRTALIGPSRLGGRSRLELRLRQLPDRNWSPAMCSAALRGRNTGAGAAEWLGLVTSLSKARRDLKRSASPAQWAVYIDEMLKSCGWPGTDALSSDEFQLVNRWRNLLNDLARLDLVSPAMSLGTAIRRLELMAAETVFQPESERHAVQLMGPLEASGAEFDAIWISGLTAANWPPPGNPSPLLSRQLQRQRGMPDAEPSDTVDYARSVLLGLGRSAKEVVCSYALNEDDAEQAPSDLLGALGARGQPAAADPGWHAAGLSATVPAIWLTDKAPPVDGAERLYGGAYTLQLQLSDPLAAFVAGRLGGRCLMPQAVGLPALLRGNIIHDALYQFYSDAPTQCEIAGWTDDELSVRIANAIDFAFVRHERNSDSVLHELLKLERQRVTELLKRFVELDRAREEFAIVAVERELAFAEANVRLQLRADRIDRLPDGTQFVLDYKTGAKKTFLDSEGMPKELQLVAYSMALREPVSAMALVNIDAREMSLSGAGRGFTVNDEWEEMLAGWQETVGVAARQFSEGDVRIDATQSVKDAREFNLLSRFTELLRGD